MSHRDKEYISKDLMPGMIFPGLFFMVVMCALFYGLLLCTWDIGVPALGLSSLGRLSSHSAFLVDGIWYLLGFAGDSNLWVFYMRQAEESGVVSSIAVHLAIPFVIAVSISFWLALIFNRALIPKLIHVSGLKYFDNPKTALMELRDSIRKADGGGTGGVPIHPEVPIDKERDNRGLLIVGGMGAGKTQFQLPRIKSIIEQGHRLFINDSKGDFTQSLESDDFVLLACWDARSLEWDIGADVCDRSSARVLAELFIKESHDPMWSLAARQVLVGMLVSLIETKPSNWGFQDLVEVMILDAESLASLIAKYNPEAIQTIRNLESETGKTADGIMINLQSFMSPFYDMAKAWNGVGGFSIRKWLQDDYEGPKTIVVQGSKRFKTIAQGLVSSLLTFVISDMADPSFPEAKHRIGDYRVYFNLDEFPTMGRVPDIEPLISVCRSKGAYVTLAFQDLSQGIALYGEELINTWITNLSNKIIGAVAVGPTASFISKSILGKREVKIPTSSTTYDSHGNPSKTISYPKDEIDVIKPYELALDLGFSKSFGYGLYLGEKLEGVYRLKWKITYTRMVRPPVIFADWASGKINTTNSFSDSFPLNEEIIKEDCQGETAMSSSIDTNLKDEIDHVETERFSLRIKDLSDGERLSLLECLENSNARNSSAPIVDVKYLPLISNELQLISYKLSDPERGKDADRLSRIFSSLKPHDLNDPLLKENIHTYLQRRNELKLRELV